MDVIGRFRLLLLLGLGVLFSVFPMSSLFSQGRVIRVDALSAAFPHKADGSSWGKAYPDIHLALAAARNGDKVWVASGTYPVARVSDVDPANRVFRLALGVSMHGSFPNREQIEGDESRRDHLNDRDFVAYPTILTGDTDGSGGPTMGDAKRVVLMNTKTVVDGFSIKTCYGERAELSTLVHVAGGNSGLVRCRISGGLNESQYSPGVSFSARGCFMVYCIVSGNRNRDRRWHGTDVVSNTATIVNSVLASNSGGRNVLVVLTGVSPNASKTATLVIENTIMLSPDGGVFASVLPSQNVTKYYKERIQIRNSYYRGKGVSSASPTRGGEWFPYTDDAEVTKVEISAVGTPPPRLDADFRQVGTAKLTKNTGRNDVHYNYLNPDGMEHPTDIFGTVVPQGGNRDIGVHELVPENETPKVDGFLPTAVFRGVDKTVAVLGSGFGGVNVLGSNRVTFLGNSSSASDDKTVGPILSGGTTPSRLLVPLPDDIKEGKVKVRRGGVESEVSLKTLKVKKFTVRTFETNTEPVVAYPEDRVRLGGTFPPNEDARLKVILPNGKSVPLSEVTSHFIEFYAPSGERQEGKLKVIFGPLEVESPWDFKILEPELISIPSSPVNVGDKIVLQGRDFYDPGRFDFSVRVFFEGVSGRAGDVAVDNDASTLTVKVPAQAVSGHLVVALGGYRLESEEKLSVVGRPAPKFGIEDFTEEAFRSTEIVVLGTFSSISNRIGFPNGRGGHVFVDDLRREAPDEFTLSVPVTAFSGRLVLLTPGEQRFLSTKEISILPKLRISFPRGGAPGSLATITGRGFSKYPENNSLVISDIRTPILSSAGNSLNFVIPQSATEPTFELRVFSHSVTGPFPLHVVRIRNLRGLPVEPGDPLVILGYGFARGEDTHEVTFLGDPSIVEDDVVVGNLLALRVRYDALRLDPHLGAIRFVPPTHAPVGPVQVRVGGNLDVSREIFRFTTTLGQVREIVISEIRPLSVGKGGVVVLRGSGFGILAEHNRVFFGDKFGNDLEAEVLSASTKSIRVRVPERASGGPVEVEVGGRRVVSKQAVEIVDLRPIYHTVTSSSAEQVVYPNPIRDGRLYCARVFEHIKLYDVSMREVFSVLGKDYSSAAGIDLSFLSPGVYFAKVRLGDGEELRLKLLKE